MEVLNKNSKYIGFGGCILTIIGCFLPWITVLGMSINWFEGDGKLAILASIVTAVLIYLKKDKLSLITSGLIALFFLIDGSKVFSNHLTAGLGFYTIFLGIVCMIAYPFINKQ